MELNQSGEASSTSSRKRDLLELFVVSFLSLFFELIFIRWMSADIRAFSIFKTFPLVACFIGLGVGCSRRNDNWFAWTPVLLFFTVAVVKFAIPVTGLEQFVPANLASFNWTETMAHEAQWLRVTAEFMMFLAIVLALPFFTMACIGSRIGVLFARLPALEAYSADILGALTGSIVSSLASIVGASPELVLSGALPILALASWSLSKNKKLLALTVIAALTICLLPFRLPPATWSYWTPYQHLTLKKFTDDPLAPPDKSHDFYWLFVNGRSYQACWNQAMQEHPMFRGFLVPYWSRCFMPYRLSQPRDVLVVAAGMGMDIHAAIKGGAQTIDAVDLDPVILRLGKQLNPCHPYDSEKVSVHCDDARHFFMSANKQYDAIVFSHLDSQTVLGQSSSVRLDNFVYTRESFQRALKLLKPDGLLFVCFNAKKDWFRDRMYWTLAEAAGYKPVLFKDPVDVAGWSFFCVAGKTVKDGTFKLPNFVSPIDSLVGSREKTRILTDDWPYMYVQAIDVDWTYIVICLEIIIITALVGRRLFAQATPALWQMFLLGSAFLLLELQSINRLSLLYGTTWITSAVVINGVLILVLVSNLVSIKWKAALSGRLPVLYACLFGALLLSFALPIDQILSQLGWSGGRVLITFFTLIPIFFGGLIFPTSFAKHKDAALAFAFNLCGATLGALLEYQAHFTGINSLVLVSLGLYLISFLAVHFSEKRSPI